MADGASALPLWQAEISTTASNAAVSPRIARRAVMRPGAPGGTRVRLEPKGRRLRDKSAAKIFQASLPGYQIMVSG